MITCRPAGPLDARPLAELINEIIEAGGSTALTTLFTPQSMRDWMTRAEGRAAWTLAEDESGTVLGFQCIEPAEYLPEEAVEIATFARRGRTGLGIGSALFERTKAAARALGYAWINANIRADNAGGLAYYQSRGFEDYAIKRGVDIGGGLTVDKVFKRYDL
ncbi:GNAT family N-acetyltransferase [Pseudoponticoccus marisrubri]|uniref:Acetyltransferase n=1 Tax=Pseudoponticoccus marisrubri TaxID=1685382 RepID=A0A0W7WFZ2_9RHOB|nr:GNAT family N-acetyltransferase [Pseudoponticoccus marisrubri]KUF09521.1 acetyltransferase [Pseudoponticoccus marisrubri]